MRRSWCRLSLVVPPVNQQLLKMRQSTIDAIGSTSGDLHNTYGRAQALRSMASLVASNENYVPAMGEVLLTEGEFSSIRSAITAIIRGPYRLPRQIPRHRIHSMIRRFEDGQEFRPRVCFPRTELARSASSSLLSSIVGILPPTTDQVLCVAATKISHAPTKTTTTSHLRRSTQAINRALSLVNLSDISILDRVLLDIYTPEPTSFGLHGAQLGEVHTVLSSGKWSILSGLAHDEPHRGLIVGSSFKPKVRSPRVLRALEQTNSLLDEFNMSSPYATGDFADPLSLRGDVEDWLGTHGYIIAGREVVQGRKHSIGSSSSMFESARVYSLNRTETKVALTALWKQSPPSFPILASTRIPCRYWLDAASVASLKIDVLPGGTWCNAGRALLSAIIGVGDTRGSSSSAYQLAVLDEACSQAQTHSEQYVVLHRQDVELITDIIQSKGATNIIQGTT